MQLRPIDPDLLENWRKRYRNQLSIPVIPDFHEALCRLGQAYLVEEVGQTLGYVILAEETFVPDWAPVIPEVYLELKQTKSARQILNAVFEKLRPNIVIGRSDDRFGFPLLMDMRVPNQVSASLYTLKNPPAWAENDQVNIIESTIDDIRRLLPFYSSIPVEEGGIHDEMALAKSLAAWRHYRLTIGKNVLAICYIVPQDQHYITATPIVEESVRGKGYGRYLLSFALKRELAEGKIFVAALNPDNDAARGLVESVGAHLESHFINFRPGL